MKKINGYKSEAPAKKTPMLPAGAYVAAIKNVKVEGNEPDQRLVLRLDVIEGEWAGYFTKRYENDSQSAGFFSNFQATYKGDYKIQIPDERNPKRQHPEWDLKRLNNSIWCIEQSNPGFHWDGEHEMDLKGKIVGINMQEGTYNGNPYTTIGKLEVVDDVRSGNWTPMKPRAERTASQTVTGVDTQTGFVGVETDELPF